MVRNEVPFFIELLSELESRVIFPRRKSALVRVAMGLCQKPRMVAFII